jgi:hypothetical protein
LQHGLHSSYEQQHHQQYDKPPDNAQLFHELFGHVSANAALSLADPSLDSKSERDRRVHREAEKQRRESLRSGFEKLKDLLPASTIATDKNWSQTRLLETALDYIGELKKVSDAKAREWAGN